MQAKVKYLSYTFKESVEKITSPDILYKAVKGDFSPINEDMYLLVLNIKNKVIDKFLVARGGYNTLTCTPRDIFIRLLKTGQTNFVISHNHPSGDTTPSQEDIIFAKKLRKGAELLGCNFIEHLIINSHGYYSFRKNGIL